MSELLVARHPFDEVGDVDVGSFLGSIGKAIGGAAKAVGHAVSSGAQAAGSGVAFVSRQVAHVPILGGVVSKAIDLSVGAPFGVAAKILSGGRIDRAVLSGLKQQLKLTRELAPYAQTVVSMVPGVGTGVAGAIAAATAIADGRPVTEALKAGVKGALPGGPLAQAAFELGSAAITGGRLDSALIRALPIPPAQQQIVAAGLATAKALAHGERVDQALLNNAVNALPADARKAVQIGMALGHGQVLQAVKSASDLAKQRAVTVGPVKDIFGRVTNPISTAQRRAISIIHPELRRVSSALAANPTLTRLPATDLARRLNVSLSHVQRAVASQPGLTWRPLSTPAASFVRQIAPFASFRSLTDTRGLAPDGLVYVVEKGDYPGKIAKALTGKESRWPELVKANPQKKTVNRGIGPEFATLVAGEKLNVPSSWRVAPAPAPAGAPPVSSTPLPAANPQMGNTAAILQAKGILVTWSKTDGANVAGFKDYGTNPADLSTDFGERDKFMLASFEQWANGRGASLPTDGVLNDVSLAALRAWAEQRVAAPLPAPLPPAPEAMPAPAPAPAPAPTQTAPAPIVLPTLPSVPLPSLPASPLPTLPPIETTPAPATQIELPDMTIPGTAPAKPATPEPASASTAKGGSLVPAVMGAVVGFGVGGFLGAVIGGGAGLAVS